VAAETRTSTGTVWTVFLAFAWLRGPAITDIEQPCLRGRSHRRQMQGPAVADIKGPLL